MIRHALVLVAAAAVCSLAAAASVLAAQQYPVSYHSFPLSAGEGTVVAKGALTLGSSGLTTTTYSDPHLGTTRTYQTGSWTSPEYRTGFGFTELVASWIAKTPPGTFIRISMRADRGDGSFTKPYLPTVTTVTKDVILPVPQ